MMNVMKDSKICVYMLSYGVGQVDDLESFLSNIYIDDRVRYYILFILNPRYNTLTKDEINEIIRKWSEENGEDIIKYDIMNLSELSDSSLKNKVSFMLYSSKNPINESKTEFLNLGYWTTICLHMAYNKFNIFHEDDESHYSNSNWVMVNINLYEVVHQDFYSTLLKMINMGKLFKTSYLEVYTKHEAIDMTRCIIDRENTDDENMNVKAEIAYSRIHIAFKYAFWLGIITPRLFVSTNGWDILNIPCNIEHVDVISEIKDDMVEFTLMTRSQDEYHILSTYKLKGDEEYNLYLSALKDLSQIYRVTNAYESKIAIPESIFRKDYFLIFERANEYYKILAANEFKPEYEGIDEYTTSKLFIDYAVSILRKNPGFNGEDFYNKMVLDAFCRAIIVQIKMLPKDIETLLSTITLDPFGDNNQILIESNTFAASIGIRFLILNEAINWIIDFATKKKFDSNKEYDYVKREVYFAIAVYLMITNNHYEKLKHMSKLPYPYDNESTSAIRNLQNTMKEVYDITYKLSALESAYPEYWIIKALHTTEEDEILTSDLLFKVLLEQLKYKKNHLYGNLFSLIKDNFPKISKTDDSVYFTLGDEVEELSKIDISKKPIYYNDNENKYVTSHHVLANMIPHMSGNNDGVSIKNVTFDGNTKYLKNIYDAFNFDKIKESLLEEYNEEKMNDIYQVMDYEYYDTLKEKKRKKKEEEKLKETANNIEKAEEVKEEKMEENKLDKLKGLTDSLQEIIDKNPAPGSATVEEKVVEEPPRKEPIIAVYAICRNEQMFVRRWLESMREADYIFVIDTGSTDDTVDTFMEEWGNVVRTYPDTKCQLTVGKSDIYNKSTDPKDFDFAIARNESLDRCLKSANQNGIDHIDIYVSTDLDEFLDPGWASFLKKNWIVGKHTRAKYKYAWSHTDSGQPARIFAYNKFHAPNWRWKYPVHELLVDENDNERYPYEEELDAFDEIYLHHFPDQTKSRGSYLGLLEKRVRENPTDVYGKIYLGHEYFYQQQYQDAINTLKVLIENEEPDVINDPTMYASVYLFIGDSTVELYKQAVEEDPNTDYGFLADTIERFYTKSFNIAPYYREAYIALAKFLVDNKKNDPLRYERAELMLSEAIKNGERQYLWLENDSSWTYDIWLYRSLIEYYKPNPDYRMSLFYAAYALSFDPMNQLLKDNLESIKNKLTDEQIFNIDK